jgi:uncharacterized protein (TIGR00251 family)
LLTVTVTPRSARNQIAFDADGSLRVRVTAPPVDGAANAAVIRLLAATLGVPRSSLVFDSGERGRSKRILVHAVAPGELQRRLAMALDSPPSY